MFKPGESGNPKGRPRNAENRLTRKAKYYAEKFLDEINRQGISEVSATGKMSDYVNIIKTVLPKDFNIAHSGSIDIPPAQIVIDGKVINDSSD